jgi:transposase
MGDRSYRTHGLHFPLFCRSGGVDAAEREFGDGRASSLCRKPARWGLEGEPMTDVCREFGISRKTGYKIFNRYREHGCEAFSDRSRRPVRYANQLPPQVESQIVTLKREKPHWGARKIRELLLRWLASHVRVPAKSTIHAVLDRHGLVKRRAKGVPMPPERRCHTGRRPTICGAPIASPARRS